MDHRRPTPNSTPQQPRQSTSSDDEVKHHFGILNGKAERLVMPDSTSMEVNEIGRGGESVAFRVTARSGHRHLSLVALAPLEAIENPDHGSGKHGTTFAHNIFTSVVQRHDSETARLLKIDATHQRLEMGLHENVKKAVTQRDASILQRMLSPRAAFRQQAADVEAGLNLAHHRVDARFVRIHASGTMAHTSLADSGKQQLHYTPVTLMEEARGSNAVQALAQGHLSGRDCVLIAAATALKSGKQIDHGLFNADIKPANIMADKDDQGNLQVRGIDFGQTKPIRQWMREDTLAGSFGWTCFGITNAMANASAYHLEEKLTATHVFGTPEQTRAGARALLTHLGDDIADGRPLTPESIDACAHAIRHRNPAGAQHLRTTLRAALSNGPQASHDAAIGHRIIDAVSSSQRPPQELMRELDHAVTHASAASLLSLLSGRQPLSDEMDRTEPGMRTLVLCVESSGINAPRADLYKAEVDAVEPGLRAQYGETGEEICALLTRVFTAKTPQRSDEFARDLTRIASRMPSTAAHQPSRFKSDW